MIIMTPHKASAKHGLLNFIDISLAAIGQQTTEQIWNSQTNRRTTPNYSMIKVAEYFFKTNCAQMQTPECDVILYCCHAKMSCYDWTMYSV